MPHNKERKNIPTIPDALEFRREQYGWTQKFMAEEIGISASHYSEVVSGKRKLSYHAACCAHAIGVPASVLLYDDHSYK